MYICRQCPEATRDRCIAQSHTSPSTREMIRRAFEARRDTEEMWRILQINCLRIREEQEEKTYHESALARRLRLARSREKTEEEEEEEAVAPDTTELVPASSAVEPVQTVRPRIREVGRVEVKPPPPPVVERVPERPEEPEADLFSLILEPSKRRIALPTDGEIVFGRPDPNVDFFPDIDLTYEDQGRLAISRRHARIYGENNVHFVEDMGSTNGTKVNAELLELGQKRMLRQGDRMALGHCLLVYGPTPKWILNPPSHIQARFYLLTTSSCQRIDLPDQGELIIGRSDPALSFVPDIDLRDEGEVSERVARRHAKITCQGHTHSLEDLGSPYGTKINGTPVLLEQTIQLTPGDHIWLGGCVLAYEIEAKGV